jgi:hypothetical protein
MHTLTSRSFHLDGGVMMTIEPRTSGLSLGVLLIALCFSAGCGREDKVQPDNETKRPPTPAAKAKSGTDPAAGNIPVAQEATLKAYLVSANTAKKILSEIKGDADVDDAILKLQKEGDNVRSIIKQLEREGPPPQPLTQYAADLATILKTVREASDPRNLPESLPQEKRDALIAAARRFFDLMREFNRMAQKHKLTASGAASIP